MKKSVLILSIIISACAPKEELASSNKTTSATESAELAKRAEISKAALLTGAWSNCFSYSELGLGNSSNKTAYSFSSPDLVTIESSEYSDDDCGLKSSSKPKETRVTRYRYKTTEVEVGVVGKIDFYPIDSFEKPNSMGIFKIENGNLYLGFNGMEGNPPCDGPIQDSVSAKNSKAALMPAPIELTDSSVVIKPATGAPESPFINCRANLMGEKYFSPVKQ